MMSTIEEGGIEANNNKVLISNHHEVTNKSTGRGRSKVRKTAECCPGLKTESWVPIVLIASAVLVLVGGKCYHNVHILVITMYP